MKERMYVVLAAVALLVTVTVSIAPAAPTGEGRRGDVHRTHQVSGGHVRQTANEQVARLRADAECQSGCACGG